LQRQPFRFHRFLGIALLLALGACATNKQAEEAPDPEDGGIAERVRHYQEAIRTNPDHAESHYRLGNALLDMGRFQDAYYAYQKAIRLEPGYADAYANLGLALRRMGNLKAAAGAYVQALDFNPDDAVTLNNLLVVAQLMEDWERVEWCVEKMAGMHPDDPGLLEAHADVLCQLGRHAEAAARYEAAAGAREPAQNLYRAGVCYFDLERWPDAIAIWERARAIEPDNPSVNRGLAVAHWESGDAAAARAAVERCRALGIALDPEFLQLLEGAAG